jgi:Flp pilus assembly protein TadD
LRQAVRLASRVTDRERLLILGAWANAGQDPAFHAFAETIAVRYPWDPDGHEMLARALSWKGDFLGAVPHLRRVLEMDSLSLRDAMPRCRACDALSGIITAYWFADSLSAAERTAREWIRLQPASPQPWFALAATLDKAHSFDEARAALRTGHQLLPGSDPGLERALLELRAGRFGEADGIWREQGNLWWQSISLRVQGRLADALATSRRMRALAVAADPTADHPGEEALAEAQALFESGRPRQAAALFDSIGRHYERTIPWLREFPGALARRRTWMLTHATASLAAAGDTTRLAALADSMEVLGRRSSYGRDQRLHHHVRGLLLVARGRTEDAAGEFRRAIYSPTEGYTRTNLELGRALLVLGRSRDAVAALRPALHGPIQASNTYVTLTDIHELLAQAFEAAGERDSAVAHYRWVLHAWERADPAFQSRVEAARRHLAELGATVNRSDR